MKNYKQVNYQQTPFISLIHKISYLKENYVQYLWTWLESGHAVGKLVKNISNNDDLLKAQDADLVKECRDFKDELELKNNNLYKGKPLSYLFNHGHITSVLINSVNVSYITVLSKKAGRPVLMIDNPTELNLSKNEWKKAVVSLLQQKMIIPKKITTYDNSITYLYENNNREAELKILRENNLIRIYLSCLYSDVKGILISKSYTDFDKEDWEYAEKFDNILEKIASGGNYYDEVDYHHCVNQSFVDTKNLM